MTPCPTPAQGGRLLARCGVLAVALMVASGGEARAQTAPAAAASDYQDRVIEGLAPSIDEEDAAESASQDPAGWARSLRFETRLGYDSFQAPGQRTTTGLGLYGLIETPNHGVLSIDAQRTADPVGGQFTLRQRGLPVGSGWSVNNELGVIGIPAPSLTRHPSRVYVPGQPIAGGSTEWLNAARGLQVQASSGQPGRLDGTVMGRWRRLPGTLSSVGAQVDAAPWSLAARAAQASGVALTEDPVLSGGLLDAHSAMLAARHDSGNGGLQANLVTTRSSSTARAMRSGLWVDADLRDGSRQHSAGVFWLEPDLSWAGLPMASDVAGGYLRSAWSTREWSTEGNLDLLRSVSAPSASGAYVSGSARWRLSRRMSIGVGAAYRDFNGSAYNTYAEARWQSGWGSSALRLDLARELAQSRSHRLTLDHEWPLDTGWTLATSLSAGKVIANEVAQTVWGTAAAINAPVSSAVSLNGNLSLEQARPGDTRISVNAGLNWRLTPRWSMEGRYTLARGRTASSPLIDPLAPPLPFASSIADSHSVFVLLRWEDRAGTRSAPLGGRPQDGGGRIEGVLFLDANRNGIQEAGEGGAAGATVMLDSLYTAKTDAQGRFEFPFVAAGERTLTVLNETLPLPWIAPGEARTRLTVRLRDTAALAIPVTRQGTD